ncbi:MAG TPA: hypothetical protein DEQ40_19140 [Oxalobacteraceae bacterium]|jgi:hypothetical protein|nr:hypothetical protein [Oxalobacteraceae bacterium]
MTVLDLGTDALQELGIYGIGDTVSAADAAKVLTVLNRMVDAENTVRANIYTLNFATVTLTPSLQTYTMGPGGTLAATRPIRIERANLVLSSSPSSRLPLAIYSEDEWASIAVQQVVTIPQGIYNDGNFPLATLYFYPIPDQGYTVELYTWQQVAQFVATTDAVVIPPGYQDYWVYELAIRLAPSFGVQPSGVTVAMAKRAELRVQSLNTPSPKMASDPALVRDSGRGGWNRISRSFNP